MKNHLTNDSPNDLVPSSFYLGQNYPNPFKGRTVIKYCVASRTRVLLTIHDAEGKEIKKLVDEEKDPGTYEVEFSSEYGGRQLVAGDYYYCLKTGDYTNEKKMILQK